MWNLTFNISTHPPFGFIKIILPYSAPNLTFMKRIAFRANIKQKKKKKILINNI